MVKGGRTCAYVWGTADAPTIFVRLYAPAVNPAILCVSVFQIVGPVLQGCLNSRPSSPLRRRPHLPPSPFSLLPNPRTSLSLFTLRVRVRALPCWSVRASAGGMRQWVGREKDESPKVVQPPPPPTTGNCKDPLSPAPRKANNLSRRQAMKDRLRRKMGSHKVEC